MTAICQRLREINADQDFIVYLRGVGLDVGIASKSYKPFKIFLIDVLKGFVGLANYVESLILF